MVPHVPINLAHFLRNRKGVTLFIYGYAVNRCREHRSTKVVTSIKRHRQQGRSNQQLRIGEVSSWAIHQYHHEKSNMNSPTEPLEVHIPVGSSESNAVDLLQQATGLAKQQIKSAMTQGAVWLTRGNKTQRLRRAKRELAAGDELHLYYNADILAEIPAEPTLIADLGGYSVWRKRYAVY